MKPCLECRRLFGPSDLKRPENFKRARYCCRPCYDKARTFDPTSPAKADTFFWPKVDSSRGQDSCWLWTAAKFKFTGRQRGYGRFAGSGPYTYAHRVAWIIENGPIPEGKLIMHLCDEPLCCNPWHMRLGTDAENYADAKAKGRHAHGERGRHRLTEAQALEILSRRTGKRGEAAAFAREYSVPQTTVGALLRGATWKHLKRPFLDIPNGQ